MTKNPTSNDPRSRKNVLQFPAKDLSNWTFFERAINDFCAAHNFSREASDYLMNAMKDFWQILSVDLSVHLNITFPDNVHEADQKTICASVGRELSQANSERINIFANQLFNERFHREVLFLHHTGLVR